MDVPEEERFARNATVMAQAIHESITKLYEAGYRNISPDIIAIAVAIISSFEKNYLIQGFISNSHKECWDYIKQRSELFFINNAGQIFQHLPFDQVSLFRDLFTTKDSHGNCVVPQSLKDQLWCIFDAMVKICIKYIHKHRAPRLVQGKKVYQKDFFNEVNLDHHAKVWGINLEFPSN